MRAFRKSLLLVVFLISFKSQAQGTPQYNLLNFTKAPEFLSEFGFFQDMQNQIPADGIHPYSLVSPLFSDKTDLPVIVLNVFERASLRLLNIESP